jgi:ATP synthase protein I
MANRWAAALRFTGVGFYIGGCIAGAVYLGVWLDRKYDLSPLFTLIGLFTGLFLAVYGTYRMLLPFIRSDEDGENDG